MRYTTGAGFGGANEQAGQKAIAGPELDVPLKNEIVRRSLVVTQPRRIMLFGSAALGAIDKDSDVDLLVLEDNDEDPREVSRRIRAALMDLAMPFDILVMPASRFEETKEVIGGIAYPANKYGQVLYEGT